MKFRKKTVAIILVVVIGLSLFVGIASAATGKVSTVTQILQILLGIQPEITPNSLRISSAITVLASSSRFLELLPVTSEVTYSGHITINVAGPYSRVFIIAVLLDGDYVLLNTIPTVGTVNTDFSSIGLWVTIENADSTDILVNLAGVVQYYNCTNSVTWIPHDREPL